MSLRIMPKLIVTALSLSCLSFPVYGQLEGFPTTPRFQSIVQLAQEGRADSARTLITAELQSLAATDALYPEALYTAATIASSGDDARLFFSRVAVEFSRSEWADNSLLRLAQLDFGRGESETSTSRVERLMIDYPDSEVFADAMLWGARASMELGKSEQACSWLDLGLERVGDHVELRNQMEFAQRRCRAGVTAQKAEEIQPEVTPPTSETPTLGSSEEAGAGPWRIQVAAISSATAIRRVEAAILEAGLRVYRVAGPNGLTKLQAGPFDTAADARSRVKELGDAVGTKPFIVRSN